MTQQEIHNKVKSNYAKMESLFTPGKFTLNSEVSSLIEENIELQSMCKHEFENGTCIYCYACEK